MFGMPRPRGRDEAGCSAKDACAGSRETASSHTTGLYGDSALISAHLDTVHGDPGALRVRVDCASVSTVRSCPDSWTGRKRESRRNIAYRRVRTGFLHCVLSFKFNGVKRLKHSCLSSRYNLKSLSLSISHSPVATRGTGARCKLSQHRGGSRQLDHGASRHHGIGHRVIIVPAKLRHPW